MGEALNETMTQILFQEQDRATHALKRACPLDKLEDGGWDDSTTMADDDDANSMPSSASEDEEDDQVASDDAQAQRKKAIGKSLLCSKICRKSMSAAMDRIANDPSITDQIGEPPLPVPVLRQMRDNQKFFNQKTAEDPTILWQLFRWAQQIAKAMFETMKANVMSSLTNVQSMKQELEKTEEGVHHLQTLMQQLKEVINSFLWSARHLKDDLQKVQKELSNISNVNKVLLMKTKSDVCKSMFRLSNCKQAVEQGGSAFHVDLEAKLDEFSKNMEALENHHQQARRDQIDKQSQRDDWWSSVPLGFKGQAFAELGLLGTILGAALCVVACCVAHVAVCVCVAIVGAVAVIGGIGTHLAWLIGCCDDATGQALQDMLKKFADSFSVLRIAMNELKNCLKDVKEYLTMAANQFSDSINRLFLHIKRDLQAYSQRQSSDVSGLNWCDPGEVQPFMEHLIQNCDNSIPKSLLDDDPEEGVKEDLSIVCHTIKKTLEDLDELEYKCEVQKRRLNAAIDELNGMPADRQAMQEANIQAQFAAIKKVYSGSLQNKKISD